MNPREVVMGVFRKARAFWEARILMTAAELDIFSAIADRPKTAKELAAERGYDARATEYLLNAVAAMGLLDKKDGAFRVRPGLERFLSNSTPETVIPLILHMAHMWDNWGTLTEIVKEGKHEKERPEWEEAGLKAFIGAMHTIGRGLADSVVAKLDLSGRKKLLDVGGGSGVYTIAMLKRAPEMRATIFDRKPVLEIARQKVAEEGLSERVEFAPGDFYKHPLPGGHDIALLSAIIHQNSHQQNIDLYRKVHDALVPGGEIVIRDHVMSEDHTQSAEGAFFAINMLINTPGGGTYSFGEIKEGLEAAGFRDVTLVHKAEMDSLVTGVKK
ncbi:MAG: methyltransferase [Candidatus Abyssubacteria bacterium]